MSIRRRGRGEGSIRRRADGRWEARVDLGWIDGKRVRKSIFGRTRREVADRLPKALEHAKQGGRFADERQTVEQFLERWLDYKRERLRERTLSTYEIALRLHLIPGLGKLPLARLTPAHVESWFHRHQQKGASARNIR